MPSKYVRPFQMNASINQYSLYQCFEWRVGRERYAALIQAPAGGREMAQRSVC